jgi:hypothetical protein
MKYLLALTIPGKELRMLSDLKVRNPTGFKKLITERTQSSGI